VKGHEIRKEYLKFFEAKGHLVAESASLVPDNDPSLLLIGAGMAPFKAYFTGAKVPPNRRMASSQKCVRTGDIERVGVTARHHTFFEMLGNFSFGDYFKKEGIAWAWEFLLEHLKLDRDKLWVSVYQDDQEAWDIWHREVGIPEDRMVRLGKEDNFWEVGVGPCGPCSEIYVDMGPELGCDSPHCKPGCDCDRYLEIWNLVFTQFDKDEEGVYHLLPAPNIDTGMGLERIAAVMQGVTTNYDSDLVFPIIQHFAHMAQVDYGKKPYTQSLRVIGDHLRAVAFMLADGVLPTNDGRGYILRRLLRRAVRHGMLCGLEGSFLHTGVEVVVDLFGDVYPELFANREHLLATIKAEEERFLATISQGMELLQRELAALGGQGILNGETAFRLYDTYGFPLELTVEISAEKGFQVDEDGFKAALERQRIQAREAREHVDAMVIKDIASLLPDIPATQFAGYQALAGGGKILALVTHQRLDLVQEGQVVVVLDSSPFYGEGGGQVGDTGVIQGKDFRLTVENVTRAEGVLLHHCLVEKGPVQVGSAFTAEVSTRRRDIQANHTATHLLHKALKRVLGDHVRQAGSLVDGERLRFDFTHSAPVEPEQIRRIEAEVNALIGADLPVDAREMPMEEARKLGAVALFGEKYGDKVRVVRVGDISIELCGGTHVPSTARIRGFKIVSEVGIGAGLRRIEALTGDHLLRHFFQVEDALALAAREAKARPDTLVNRIRELGQEVKDAQREIEALRNQLFAKEAGDLVSTARDVEGIKILAKKVQVADMGALRTQAEQLLVKLGSGVVVLGAVSQDKVNLVATVSKDLQAKGIHAGKLVGAVAQLVDGGGGGRPDMAQAGGKNPAALDNALETVPQSVLGMRKGE
jgi:alanyl-tRNA synthetase